MSLFETNHADKNLSKVEIKKRLQKKKILRELYLNDALSIADLMHRLELSAPTMQSLLDELIKDDVVHQKGSGSSKGGRKPNLYGLRNNALYVLSIDIGNYFTRMALFDSSNEKVTPIKKIKLELENDISIVKRIYREAKSLISEAAIDDDRIIGVGVDMPGLIESEKGINHSILHFGQPVRDIFSDLFKKPVVIENDAKTKALAEFRFGKAIGKNNVLVLHLGWGIGMGMILNGKPYKGACGFSGEFAHIPMSDERGLLCSCGKRGCLETVASGAALTRLAIEAIEKGEMTLISQMANNNTDEITQELIIEAAQKGDQFAIGILSKIGFELGKGIASLIQILNPEMIILAGPLAKAGTYLTTSVEQALHQYTFAIIKDCAQLTISELGEDSSLLGNVINVMESLIKDK